MKRLTRFPRLVVAAAATTLVACQGEPPTAPVGAASDPAAIVASPTSAPDFVHLTDGLEHTCGVTPDNRVFCWGYNHYGQLGDGTTTNRLLPRLVAGGVHFKVVSAGTNFTCGLGTDDKAYCWGDNSHGEVGDGSDQATRLKPAAVAGGRRFRQLRAGGDHTCAVTFNDVLFCWGNNSVEELGAPTPTTDHSNVPLEVVTGGPVFHQVIPGGAHTCALTTDKVAYCWGDNSHGQLGNSVHFHTMTPTRVSGTRTFNQMAAGQNHTCGVSGGKAYCWGTNFRGELGDGTTSERDVPTPVAGGLTFKATNALCGVTTSNQAYCWGNNSEGQVGDGTFGFRNFRTVPKKVVGGFTFVELSGSATTVHNCAITPERRAYCWGTNFFGELGNGNTKHSPRPVPVGG
ncbi:MAG: RCC1 domain-containing protein [Actinoallomurus sp.]